MDQDVLWVFDGTRQLHAGSAWPSGPKMPKKNLKNREEKAYTTTTERKSLGELFWPQRKTFQAGGGYKNPVKTRKTISTTEIFPLWAPFFSAKKSSALEQGGVCFLFPRKKVFLGLSARSAKKVPKKSKKSRIINSVQTRCIVKGEAQKSRFSGDFLGVFDFFSGSPVLWEFH